MFYYIVNLFIEMISLGDIYIFYNFQMDTQYCDQKSIFELFICYESIFIQLF